MNAAKWPKTLILALVIPALGLSWGCTTQSTVASSNALENKGIKPSEKLVPAQDSRLEDVPVPLGARFKPKSSRSYQTPGRRRVEHTYGIWAKRSLIRAFYQDNMPVHGWKLTNSIMLKGVHCLNYSKAGESCKVTIGPRNWYFQNLIEIIVQPMDNRKLTSTQGLKR